MSLLSVSEVEIAAKLPATTVSAVFTKTVANFGDRLAIRHTIPKAQPAAHATHFEEKFEQINYTWNDYNQSARAFAKALLHHKVKARDAVTIQGSNSPQWLFANVGTILAGGISAGIYASNSPEQCAHVVTDSKAKVVVVEDEKLLERYRDIKSTAIKCFVVWNKVKDSFNKRAFPAPILSWEEFLKTGEKVKDEQVDKRIKQQKPKQECALIYTSGTTGNPKGAALTHDSLTWTALAAGRRFKMDAEQKGISYLPLSHIAAQQLDCMTPMSFGYSVDIAPSDVLKGSNLRQHIVQARPSYFLAVPRVWEKFKETMEEKLEQASLPKKCLFDVCSSISRTIAPDYYYLRDLNESSSLTLLETIRYLFEACIMCLLDALIFSTVKAAIGLDNCRIAASGAGAISEDVVNFFAGINIQVMDLYGMSESSGVITLPGKNGIPAGSCGQALPGTEVRIFEPDENGEGEIIVRGRNIFKGYWNNRAATRESMDRDGFFHTGDKGKLDSKGNLFITGRLKELIKTSGGENIPPVRIEQKIMQELSIVSQAVVIGDKRNYLTCLLTLKTEMDQDNNPTDRLAAMTIEALKKIGSNATTLKAAAVDPLVQEFLMQGVKRANARADSQAQHIQKIKVLPEDFSQANGMMTATMKLKRSVVNQRYAKEIAELYS